MTDNFFALLILWSELGFWWQIQKKEKKNNKHKKKTNWKQKKSKTEQKFSVNVIQNNEMEVRESRF